MRPSGLSTTLALFLGLTAVAPAQPGVQIEDRVDIL